MEQAIVCTYVYCTIGTDGKGGFAVADVGLPEFCSVGADGVDVAAVPGAVVDNAVM